MATKPKLPRGIRLVTWTNSDGTEQKRYRVRIERKNLKDDRLFDVLDDAKAFLYGSKTNQGAQMLVEQKAAREAIARLSSFGALAERYMNKYLPRLPESTEKDPKYDHATSSARYRIGLLMRVKVSQYGGIEKLLKKGMSPRMGQFITAPKKPLGDIQICDINLQTANEIIEARLRGEPGEHDFETGKLKLRPVSKATVRREIATLQAMWNKLRHVDYTQWQTLPDKSNPFALADKTPLENHDVRRTQRIDKDAQEAFFKVLSSMRNPDMLRVFLLALTTGMRRGEILGLRWPEIDLENGHIDLPAERTKTSTARRVLLIDDAKTILQSIPRDDKEDRLFHYTESGFNANWQRAKRKAGLNDAGLKQIRFHDARREFLSTIFERIASPTLASQYSTLKDIKHIEERYLAPMNKGSLDTEEGLAAHAGHTSKQTAARYKVVQRPRSHG